MNRLTFVAVVGLLVAGAWSAGRAQARLANFEIAIESPRGPLKVTCDRGCDWRPNEGTLVCESERCRWIFTEHGRVMLGQPR
jgi:hypothetical protein